MYLETYLLTLNFYLASWTRESMLCSFVIVDGKAGGMAGYFEGFDLNKDEKVSVKEVS